MDVKSAFLNGFLNEEVFVEQPKGFQDPYFPDHVLRLKKALYGLKQAPRVSYDRLTTYLLDHGFTRDLKKHTSTPMSSSAKLSHDAAGIDVDPTLYRSMIGSLLYLTASRLDIAFSVGVCARFQATPKESHLTAVKRIIRYINGTSDYGIWYLRDSNECLAGYFDADWAGCIDDRKSTFGGCFYLGNNLVSWMSKKQNSVSLLTAEAEYIAGASCCAQLLWMKKLLHDYGIT
ncbi:secreted RxLR effector protein 161-like [Quercus suber]|uniref:secreted RxLR effector protein 161-like n=1 Tax=Quercus suber TaxID=58331 RepID=UPI0032DE4A01